VGEGTELSISIPLADAAREYLNGAAPGINPNMSQNIAQNGASQPVTSTSDGAHNVSTTILDPSPTVQLNAAADVMRGR
ncbi:MAG TPA: hypothetical protein VKV03_10000, partial [Candidatus Binataceae bacterium]|nr:hypothetical protein [Candidatus Binataceae bacterium]